MKRWKWSDVRGLIGRKAVINVIIIAVWLVTLMMVAKCGNDKLNSARKLIDEIEYKDSIGNYNKVFYDKRFKDLKKENKQLYDSLKEYKDKIDVLIQFEHTKEYKSGRVYIHDTVYADSLVMAGLPEPRTFEYDGEASDTFEYKLSINASVEPNWYSFDAKVKNKFTIVNKTDGNGLNHITIGSNGGGDISNVTVFKKKETRKLKDRIFIGPSATFGYDPINKNVGVTFGIGVGYDLW